MNITEKLNIEVSAYGQKRTVKRILGELSRKEIEDLFGRALETLFQDTGRIEDVRPRQMTRRR